MQQNWQTYKALCDRPEVFTRWMIERTLVVIEQSLAGKQGDQNTRELGQAKSALMSLLTQTPLAPPQPVDPRVDMLLLRLPKIEAQAIVDLFDDAALLPGGDWLDAVQQKRENPWGGFREAWLEHYNHCDEKGENGVAQTEVKSEVAGSVWKVHVSVGDSVSLDQELMILESMKMEIPVEAPSDGRIVDVLVAPEEGVEEDQVLLIIES